jgi:WD40 repeat protein
VRTGSCPKYSGACSCLPLTACVTYTGSVDNTVKVWALSEDAVDKDKGQVVADSRVPQLHPAGQVTNIGIKEKEFKLLATFDGHGDTITNVRYHPQGSLAITCSRDKEVV